MCVINWRLLFDNLREKRNYIVMVTNTNCLLCGWFVHEGAELGFCPAVQKINMALRRIVF